MSTSLLASAFTHYTASNALSQSTDPCSKVTYKHLHGFTSGQLRCNTHDQILAGYPLAMLNKLQQIHNAAVKVINGGNKFNHATPLHITG